MQAGDGGRRGGEEEAKRARHPWGLNRFSQKKPVPTPSMRSPQPPSLAAPAAPQSGFNWIYIQTGKNPVLSQVGCGSREPQINLKENKKLKKLFHFLFSAHDQGNFWIFFLCKSVI